MDGYGDGLYGAGPYGAVTEPPPQEPPPPPAEGPRSEIVRPPSHLLHIGPWAAGVQWRAIPNMGLMPTVKYPAEPLRSIPETSSIQFTLSRDSVSEASIDFTTDCDNAVVVQEMVTDLWWRRRNHATGITENIGRFQARDVQMTCEAGRIRSQVQWQDYRGVIEDRMIYTQDHAQGLGDPYDATTTAVTTILKDIFPVNTLVNMGELYTVNLGTIGLPVSTQMGDRVSEVVSRVRSVSPYFDWSVELVGDAAVLKLWPGGRGTDKDVTLIDKGIGYSPMRTWDRRVNADDYASFVIVTGQQGVSAAAINDDPSQPQGQRDFRTDDATIVTQAWLERKAKEIIADRAQLKPSWLIELMPGFWQGRSHIDLGDWVRVVVHLGHEQLDEKLRVEEIRVDVPPTGIENVSLTLGLPRPNPDPRAKRSVAGTIVHKIVNRLNR